MKSAKTEFKYLSFFDNNNTQFQLQSEKNITTMQIPRQPSCRLTGVQPLLRRSAKRHPLRILRPVATLAVSMTLFNDN
jgi:hypothetical protein